MAEQQPNVEKKDFDKGFQIEREEWTEKIRELSIRMKNIRELADVQVDLYYNRQILLEYSAKLGQVMSKLNAKFTYNRWLALSNFNLSTCTNFFIDAMYH